MWSLGLGLLYVLAFLVVGVAHYWAYRWRNPMCNGRLPPGSMGQPLIGETLQFFITNKSLDVHPFFKTRTQKYGAIFKTNVLGRPVVVSSDPEFNNYILRQEGTLVEMWYMDSFAKIFNQGSIESDGVFVNSPGRVHKVIRKLLLSQVGSGVIGERVLPLIEEASRRALTEWSTRESLEVKKALTSGLFDFGAKHLFGYESKENIGEEFSYMIQSLVAIPLNIWGTALHKCMKVKNKGLKLMKELMEERRTMPHKCRGDLLDEILNDMKCESFWSDDFAATLMLGILFSSFETISTTLTIGMILLGEHPMVVKELEREHKEILRKREGSDGGLTWDDYKSMSFTSQVVDEILRMSSNGVGLLRRAVKDVKYNGYTIPKGWTILVSVPCVHMNPEVYKDPLSFNPWRWKDLGPEVIAKSFIPFGWGTRMCAGADLTKTFLAVFIHVLVCNYRWEKVSGGAVTRCPIVGFPDGYHIQMLNKD